MAPWVHLYIATDRSVRLCCEADWNAPIGSLSDSSLEEIWNGDKLGEIRTKMTQGEPVAACQRCYDLEKIGTQSYRQYFNKTWSESPDRDIKFLDLRMSNKCNNKCRICCPALSTMWEKDATHLSQDLYSSCPPSPPFNLKSIENALSTVDMIHFGGGEPLIMNEHYHLLDSLIHQERFDTQLRYNTNLNTLTYKSYDVISYWNQFKSIRIEASLDGSHARAEYMRSGSSWKQIVSNIRRIQNECPHIELQINCTVSSMNIIHVPNFYKELIEDRLILPHLFAPYPLFEPGWLNIQSLPSAIKHDCTRLYESFIKGIDGEHADQIAQRFKAIISHMNLKDLDSWDEFILMTKKLDELRGEDFLSVFPEYKAYRRPLL